MGTLGEAAGAAAAMLPWWDGGPRSRAAGARAGRRGFTLLELVFALAVLVVAFLAMSRSLGSSVKMTEVHRETALATDGARQAIERLQGAEPFDQVFALFNADPGDDPVGLPAPGNGFAVAGLSAVPGDPDGLVGEIVFPSAPGLPADALFEDVGDAALGMPRDLNGDGAIDAQDHRFDYIVLPGRLVLEWTSEGRDRQLELHFALADL